MADCDHHHHEDKTNATRLLWALGVIVVFMVVEVVGGILSGSLALLADAAHMLTDALALGLAAGAQRFASQPANGKLHFGYRRAQVLAAFVNGLAMVVLLAWIVFEAVKRAINPIEIESGLMFWVAVAGLGANVVAFMILHRPHERNVNMRGAVLHVMGDLLGSAAAIIAAIVIGLTGWMQIDPLLSLLVAVLIGISAFRLIRETSHILLEGAPDDIDVSELSTALMACSPDIREVHNVQIWQLTPEHPRLTLHICVDSAESAARALEQAKTTLEQKYQIRQSTIQVDVGGNCPDKVFEDERVKAAVVPNRNQATEPQTAMAVAHK